MKTSVFLVTAGASLLAAPTLAAINGGLDLSWHTCATQRHVGSTAFDCASQSTGVDDLFGTFFVNADQDSFVGMDCVLAVECCRS